MSKLYRGGFSPHPGYVIDNAPERQDNNSGFTAIDVTFASKPAYCFFGSSRNLSFGFWYPIDAWDFAVSNSYYVDEDEVTNLADLEREERNAVRALLDEPYIANNEALEEAWREDGDRKIDEPPSTEVKAFMKSVETMLKTPSLEISHTSFINVTSKAEMVDGLHRVLQPELLPEESTTAL
ncbi:hypothetical protein FRB90_006285, partial [Tulasnella sp. 427]